MNTKNSPLINNTQKNFTTRDNLGIEGVANAMSASLCPIVNTVTPRPYYWAFITWCYWKYNDIYGYIKKTEVDEFIRRNNYFITLGNILLNNIVVNSFAGIANIQNGITNDQTSFIFNDKYLAGIGAMGYYPPGLVNMNLVITYRADTGETYKEPHITPKGIKLAQAFDKIISETEYYKHYLYTDPIPKSVLIQLGKIVQIDLKGFDECKSVLKTYLFESESREKLTRCKDYILYIKNNLGTEVSTIEKCRRVFFDEFSPRGNQRPIKEELIYTAKGWEIVIGRQYFTVGLEVIWQCMLNKLTIPMTIPEWISYVFASQSFSFNLDQPLSSVLSEYAMNSSELDNILSKERYSKDNQSLERSLKVLISIYNRLTNRDDLDADFSEMIALGGSDSVSLKRFFRIVEEYKSKSIQEFLTYIMSELLIKQHLKTAFNKMLEDRDGYYIEEINGKYLTSHEFSWGFQGNRMVQLFNVMKDLEVI